MLYFLIFLALLIGITFWYIQKNILVPSNVDAIIEGIENGDLPELMPGKKDFVQNGKVRICYEVIGKPNADKGVIVLLNGHSQSMLAYPPYFFKPIIEAGYQIIRIDNRGVGETSWINDWTKDKAYTLEDMATDVITVLDKLNIQQVHVGGFSMGGMIAQRVAISYPERIKSLTSMMTTGYYNDPDLISLPRKFYRHLVLIAIIYARKLTSIRSKMKLHLAINRQLKGDGYQFDDKEVLQKAYYELTKRNGYNKKVEAQHTRAIYLSASRYEELKKLTVSTLVVHGTSDTLVLFEHAQKYAPMIPNAKTLFIEGLGHHFTKEHTPEILKAMFQHWEVNSKKEVF